MADNQRQSQFNELPMEIILEILKYLGFRDRQALGATCKRFHEALCFPETNRNVVAQFSDIKLCDDHPLVRSFIKSRRPVKRFAFKHITLGKARRFLRKISPMARSVTFDSADLLQREFRIILRKLRSLESLQMIGCKDSIMSNPGDDKKYKSVIANIKKLSFCSCVISSIETVLPAIRRLKTLKMSHSYDFPIVTSMVVFEQNMRREVETFQNVDLYVMRRHLASLTSLDLSCSAVTCQGLVWLYDISNRQLNLRTLRLGYCHEVADNLSIFLQTQTNLVHLDLMGTMVDDDCLKIITDNLVLLEELNVGINKDISNDGAHMLTNLQHLKCLNISECSKITDKGIINGIAAQENTIFYSLNLGEVFISVKTIYALTKNFKSLRKLQLSSCANAVSDATVQAIIQNLPYLIELDLSECIYITDTALTGISLPELGSNVGVVEIDPTNLVGVSIAKLHGLQKLQIEKCERITDLTLMYGLQLRELRELNISFCSKITIVGIKALVQNAPAIESLEMNGCEVNEACVYELKTNLKRLKQLQVKYCSQLHSFEAGFMESYFNHLKSFNFFAQYLDE